MESQGSQVFEDVKVATEPGEIQAEKGNSLAGWLAGWLFFSLALR